MSDGTSVLVAWASALVGCWLAFWPGVPLWRFGLGFLVLVAALVWTGWCLRGLFS